MFEKYIYGLIKKMFEKKIYGCKNIAKDKTCFKNPINPTCIDLIITNRPKSFQESEVNQTVI